MYVRRFIEDACSLRDQGGVNPLTILESLEELHGNYQDHHARIKSPESRAKLKAWKEQALMEELVLPEDGMHS